MPNSTPGKSAPLLSHKHQQPQQIIEQLITYVKRLLLLIILISYTIGSAFAQKEQVYLHLDKYSCGVGDTMYFKAYVIRDGKLSKLSTNLYVDLFSKKGEKLEHSVFPILGGVCIGQLKIPDSIETDNYFLRAFSRYQLNFDTSELFTLPILVYNKANRKPIYPMKELVGLKRTTSGEINGISWLTTIFKGEWSSSLEIDPESKPRNLRLIAPLTLDSSLVSEINLTAKHPQRFSLFPFIKNRPTQNLLLLEDSVTIGKQTLWNFDSTGTITLTCDTISHQAGGYNSWQVSFGDSLPYISSISITDEDRSIEQATTIQRLNRSTTDNLTVADSQLDTSYISLKGTVHRNSGKPIRDPLSKTIFVAGVKDSAIIFSRLVNFTQDNSFFIDSLFFFGTIGFQYQINKTDDGRTKDINLDLQTYVSPMFDSSALKSHWMEDSLAYFNQDSIFSKSEIQAIELNRLKSLIPVIVKGWRSKRNELDSLYTTGAFSEPALFSFDIRKERRYKDLGAYLRANFPRFLGGNGPTDTPVDAMGHPLMFFVDEHNYSWYDLAMFSWERIAYIKCFENDFISDDDFIKWKSKIPHGFSFEGSGNALKIPSSKTPMIIAIYTRKDKDYRDMPGGLNQLTVPGYSQIIPFTSDRTTLYWDPMVFANSYRFHFYNHEMIRRFRVIVEGINYAGQLVHLEKLIE